jgi:hypothetical protein
MSEFVNIKLKNGEDLIAIFVNQENDTLTVENPIQIQVDPELGFFAKSWLLLARSNFVTLDKKDIIFYDDASDKAIRYYEDFMQRLGVSAQEEDDEDIDDLMSRREEAKESISELEELFTSLLESKVSTKH